MSFVFPRASLRSKSRLAAGTLALVAFVSFDTRASAKNQTIVFTKQSQTLSQTETEKVKATSAEAKAMSAYRIVVEDPLKVSSLRLRLLYRLK